MVRGGHGGSWYWWAMGYQYHLPGCGASGPAIGSPSTPSVGSWTYYADRSATMTKDFAHRTRRIAATVGSLVVIALSLAAGMKW